MNDTANKPEIESIYVEDTLTDCPMVNLLTVDVTAEDIDGNPRNVRLVIDATNARQLAEALLCYLEE